MHSLNIFSDLLNPKNHNLEKAIDIISKNENGIIVIIRNPKKELLLKDKKKVNSDKKLKRIWDWGSNFNRFRSKKN